MYDESAGFTGFLYSTGVKINRVKEELEKLIDLQQTDTLIKQLNTAIATVTERRGAIEQEFEARAFAIREVQQKQEAANGERAKIEAEIAKTKTQIEHAERNLKNAQNQKQYEASMREADVNKKALSDLETKFLEKTTEIEEFETTLAAKADEIAMLETQKNKSLEDFEIESAGNQSKLEEADKKREKVFVTLPKNLASIYDRLVKRSRDGVAVAEVKNNACSSCFMKLRPQLLVEVKMANRLVNCESCTRILYFMKEKESIGEAVGAKK